MYCKPILAALAASALLVLLPGVSLAKDYCVTVPSVPGVIAVGRGFSVPAKGTCKQWLGFSGGSLATQNNPTAGAGCTSSDQSHLSLTNTGSIPEGGGGVFIDSVTLTLPAQTGTLTETQLSSGSVVVVGPFSVVGAPCTKVAIPAVTVTSGGTANASGHTIAGVPIGN